MTLYLFNHRIKAFVLLFLCLWCTGCTPALKKYNPNRVDNNTAIVVLNVAPQVVEIRKFDKSYINPTIKATEYAIKQRGLWNVDFSFKNAFYMLEPGIYYISYAATSIASGTYLTTYYTSLPGLTPEGKVVYGAFEVRAGDVAFLGNLMMSTAGIYQASADMFSVTGTVEEATNEILNSNVEHKELAKKLRKITFYPTGSKIYRDKNGGYTLSR